MLLEAWTAGWALCRGTPPPVVVPEGYRIDVGLPGHLTRYVLPTHVPELAARLTAPGTWLKICAESPALDERWQVQAPEYLMSTRLTTEAPTCPPEYELEVITTGALIHATITHHGELAARGQAALAQKHAVFDQVITEPQHQRRGLGTTVMQALGRAAHHGGARTGVLVATADGLALYSRLGWVLASPVTAARLCARGCPELRADPPPG
ncbi:GNAT family N-acetyltransferase [Streptomyces sp. SID13031]|uniref:GNAT family N-acetyltransferase n=1 Tax=Streptomyces sp. SID13031 TaxID=2706046 RepID=UPI0013C6DC8E|nr:GNAT family N-acetyltransferase [Streptomyces sp. SID13031]NEA32217.1 GNAT family N-acetyltransferase [Streptomyces sp. SID13031]